MKKSLVLAVLILLVSCFAVSALTQGQRYYVSGTLASSPVWNPQYGKVFETVEARVPYTIDVKTENIAITKITFTINRTVSNGGITVYHLLSRPKAVPEVSANDSYEFDELRYVGFVPFDTKKLTYQFKVAKGWLENSSVSRDSIVLHFYNQVADTWDELTTKITGEDDSYVFYSAEGKGVHYLFIGRSQTGAKSESVVVPEEKESAEEASDEAKEEVSEVKTVAQSQQVAQQAAKPEVASSSVPAETPAVNTELQQPESVYSSTIIGAAVVVAIIILISILYLVLGRNNTPSGVDKELHNYISESLKRGKTHEEVRKRLLEVGWHHERVENALAKHTEQKPHKAR